MSAQVLLGAAAGAGMAGGGLLLLTGLRGRALDEQPRTSSWTLPWPQILTGTAAATVVLVATRWLAVAVAIGLVAGSWRRLFGGTSRAKVVIAQLEALAAWTESMRDLVATGLALPEALAAAADTAGPLLSAPLARLRDRLQAREPLEEALRHLADDLDDVTADLVVAALVLTSRAHGRRLNAVLTALAASTRAELVARRRIEAERRSTRRGVRIVLIVTVTMALGLRLLNPGYVEPYATPAGQLALAVVVGIFTIGFGWLHQLSTIPRPHRFLRPTADAPGPRRRVDREILNRAVAR